MSGIQISEVTKTINFYVRYFPRFGLKIGTNEYYFTLHIMKCYMSYSEMVSLFLKVEIHIL
jgi:hypothetical protein